MIEPGALSAIIATFAHPQMSEHPAKAQLREKLKPQVAVDRGVAVLPIYGTLARRPDPFEMAFFDVEDSSLILDAFESAASNREANAIVLDIDSPGGFISGGPEIADAVNRTSKRKPVVAWSGGMMASLAYWIGSQATQVVASRSATVGSVGAFATFVDYSRFLANAGIEVEVFRNKQGTFKGAGVMGTSLTDQHREQIQARIESSFAEFKNDIKRKRPIHDDSMRGQTFSGSEAKQVGMVDRIGDLSFAKAVARSLAAE